MDKCCRNCRYYGNKTCYNEELKQPSIIQYDNDEERYVETYEKLYIADDDFCCSLWE